MAIVLLLMSGDWWDYQDAIRSLEWEWNFYRVQNVSLTPILLACRDLLSVLLILLPIAFTFGLLPQVMFSHFCEIFIPQSIKCLVD